MKKHAKDIFPALIFTFVLGICVALWFLNHDLFDRGIGFLLYMIGYGEAEGSMLLQFVLAVVGILLVGIFSSYITVTLLEQKSKICIADRLHLELSENPRALLPVKTRRWELFDVEIKLLFWHNGTSYEESVARLPYWNRKTPLDIGLDLQPGSVLHWYFQTVQAGKAPQDLILKIDFINGQNNQAYCAVRRYGIGDMLVNGQKRTPDRTELSKLCGLRLGLSNLSVCNADYIAFHPVSAPLPFCADFSDGIRARVDLHNAAAHDFGMLLFREPFHGDWSFFRNEGYGLRFKLFTDAALDLRLELKAGVHLPYTVPLANTPGLHTVTVPLSELPAEDLQQVRELCFTAFCTAGKAKSGDFYLLDCEMCKL